MFAAALSDLLYYMILFLFDDSWSGFFDLDLYLNRNLFITSTSYIALTVICFIIPLVVFNHSEPLKYMYIYGNI